MKKPRKPKPKAKHRAQRLAVAHSRAQAHVQTASYTNALFTSAERGIAAFAKSADTMARRGWAELADLSAFASPQELQTRFRRLRSEARAIALPYSSEEREALALLFLPFLLVASAVVIHQSVRTLHAYITVVSAPEHESPLVRPDTISVPLVPVMPRSVANEARPTVALLTPVATAGDLTETRNALSLVEPARPRENISTLASNDTLRSAVTATQVNALSVSNHEPANAATTTLALLAPAEALRETASPAPVFPLPAYEADDDGNPLFSGICSVEQSNSETVASAASRPASGMTLTDDAFGLQVAAAAEAQVGQFVIYNDAYRSISYPMGDVPSLFGVCTDVIVRAYRAVGIDLQTLVHQARSGRGDTNIDHRRTEILRRFFSAHGETIPPTTYPEDYRPGDIVTYYRPQNRGARAHIAMVSSVIAPSGRPMIVHNRGWGPQLEDALFVDQITGHYRYRGPAATRNAAIQGSRPDTGAEAAAAVQPSSQAAAAPVTPISFEPEADTSVATTGQH